MSLQEELNFLEKMSIRAAGGSKYTRTKKPCPHSEAISSLYIEKEHFFFKQDITDEERNNTMREINEDIQKIARECTCDNS